MTHLFNSRALKRRHRVGERSGPITLLSPPLKATLALGVVIAVGGGLWATLARIPLTVEGTGVLLPVGMISTSSSQSDGVARLMFQKPSAPWQQEAWQFQQRSGSFPDQAVAQLARNILAASSAHHTEPAGQAAISQQLLRYRGTRFPAGQLMVWVQASAQRPTSAVPSINSSARFGPAPPSSSTSKRSRPCCGANSGAVPATSTA